MVDMVNDTTYNTISYRVPGKNQSFYLENPEEKKLKKSSPTDKR
jgi:hypothetical protein